METAPHREQYTAQVAPVAAAVTQTTEIAEAREDATVSVVEFIPSAAMTGNATNNRTFTVRNAGQAGSGTTVIATLTLAAGVNGVANDALVIPLTGTAADLNITSGDVLTLVETVAGTGLANPGGKLIVNADRR